MAPSNIRRASWFLLAGVLGGGCDLSTKEWAEETLREVPGGTMPILGDWLELSLVYNRGTAFSLIRNLGDGRSLLGVFALIVAVVLFVLALRTARDGVSIVGYGLIAGGAVGNGFDRLFREAPGGGTGVVDFIVVHYPGGTWPAFNVADALVAIGVGLLLLREWRRGEPRARPPLNAASP